MGETGSKRRSARGGYMKIFLVNPPCLNTRVTDDDAMAVPMGLYYIGAFLMENGFDVTVLNLAENPAFQTLLMEKFQRERPVMVGFSVLNASRHGAIKVAAELKKAVPDVKIVFGGPCATFLASHLFSASPDLDFIVRGEGEITFLELARHVQGSGKSLPEQIKGVVFRKNGGIKETAPREQIKDLDMLPHPGKYFSFQHISLSRGCPGRCTFCGSPAFWGRSKGPVPFSGVVCG